MRKFRMQFDINEDKFMTVITVLQGSISNMKIEEIEKEHHSRGSLSYPNGQPRLSHDRKYSWADDVVVKIQKFMQPGQVYFYKDLGEAVMPAFGMKAQSITGILSYMVRSNKLHRTKRGHYTLPVSK